MIVVIIILAVITAIAFFINYTPTKINNNTKRQTDSIANVLRSQVENQKTTLKQESSKKGKNHSKEKSNKRKTKKKKNKTASKKTYIERDPLSESLP